MGVRIKQKFIGGGQAGKWEKGGEPIYSKNRKAGLRAIRFPDLRHSYASWLIGNGESLAYVRDQLGHHSIQITVDLYGHLVPGANREAVNRLAAMIENAPPARQEQKRGQAESPNPSFSLVGHEGLEPSTS